MFICDTPYGSLAGSDLQGKSSMKKAQDLLKASGYDGTPIVVMKPTDLASIQKLPDVAAQLLRQAGFKVDLQAMDWQTTGGPARQEGRPGQGRLAHVPHRLERLRRLEPASPTRRWTRAARSPPGSAGPSDDKLADLRNQFMRATDDGTRRSSPTPSSARAFEIGTHAPLGEYDQPMAAREERQRLAVIGPTATSTGT
jgi:peptide/nickel transport system substrate-binding protein